MRMYDIIKKKRDKGELTTKEINYFVENYANDIIPDYQISALFMAIFLNGMNEKETLDLTRAMINSGDYVDLSKIKGKKVDKHSTGGVGDTTTLILGPMIAACKLPFVKMSGRGLGHTGGTLDKLESIKNFNVELSSEQFIENSNKINISLCSQTANITPADKKFYALRDVTATVDNLSLIASSIMSKKLAIGTDAIVLDVKVGSGAFMKNIDDALKLAKEMVNIGLGYGRETIALVTNMDEPLGNAIGNALEIKEAVQTLKGNGPKDLYELCLQLGSKLLLLGGRVKSKDEALSLLEKTIKSNDAYDKFIELVKHQNGDASYITNLDLLPKADHIVEVKSKNKGYVKSLNAEEIGKIALTLGAGRVTMDSVIDFSAGLVLNKKVDDQVDVGDILAYVHCNDLEKAMDMKSKIQELYIIGSKNKVQKKLIYGLVTKAGIELY